MQYQDRHKMAYSQGQGLNAEQHQHERTRS